METDRPIRAAKAILGDGEDGFTLLLAMFLLAALMLSLTVAVPRVVDELRRDREMETIHRGQQYTRAIQLYYRRFHAYPPDINALTGTNGIRFLRRRYTDPITGQDDWQPIAIGQNKAPLSLGFFGEPLGFYSASAGGTGSSVNGPPSTVTGSLPAANLGAASGGATFGGGMIGVSPGVARPSILVVKTKSNYNEWEFVYDPQSDWLVRGLMPVQPPPGSPVNVGSPGFSPPDASSSNPQ